MFYQGWNGSQELHWAGMQRAMLSLSFHGAKRAATDRDVFISVEALGMEGKPERVALGLQAPLIYPTVFFSLMRSFICSRSSYIFCEEFGKRIPNVLTVIRSSYSRRAGPIQENQHEPFTFGLNAV